MKWYEWDIDLAHGHWFTAIEAQKEIGNFHYVVHLHRTAPASETPWTIEVERWPLAWDETETPNPEETILQEAVDPAQGFARFDEILTGFDTILMELIL